MTLGSNLVFCSLNQVTCCAAGAPLGPDGKPLLAVKLPVPEDVKGVATAAWAKVKRGVPPSEAFKPGEGFAVLVDAARFLPGELGRQLTAC